MFNDLRFVENIDVSQNQVKITFNDDHSWGYWCNWNLVVMALLKSGIFSLQILEMLDVLKKIEHNQANFLKYSLYI